jgi:hypothetical protein
MIEFRPARWEVPVIGRRVSPKNVTSTRRTLVSAETKVSAPEMHAAIVRLGLVDTYSGFTSSSSLTSRSLRTRFRTGERSFSRSGWREAITYASP